jgi:hypothetical protein
LHWLRSHGMRLLATESKSGLTTSSCQHQHAPGAAKKHLLALHPLFEVLGGHKARGSLVPRHAPREQLPLRAAGQARGARHRNWSGHCPQWRVVCCCLMAGGQEEGPGGALVGGVVHRLQRARRVRGSLHATPPSHQAAAPSAPAPRNSLPVGPPTPRACQKLYTSHKLTMSTPKLYTSLAVVSTPVDTTSGAA